MSRTRAGSVVLRGFRIRLVLVGPLDGQLLRFVALAGREQEVVNCGFAGTLAWELAVELGFEGPVLKILD